MKKILLGIIALGFAQFQSYAQTILDVAELTLKVGAKSEEELYYGFAEGDQIIFNFEEVDGKELKEIEIVEYPESSKFMDYETKKVENKTISVIETNVYKFRFKNNNLLKGRICKIKIQRIPANEGLKKFNSTVKWVESQDTTWNAYTKDIIAGYDTTYEQKTKKTIELEEKYEDMIFDKNQRVHSQTNEHGNKTTLFFTLPDSYSNKYESKRVISWAYWVGVGEESNQAWQQNKSVISKSVQGAAGLMLSPLGAIAIGAVSSLALPSIGEDVSYGLVDEQNKNLFLGNYQYRGYDFGKGVAGYKRFIDNNMLEGTFFVILSNDNYIQGIDVNIKVSAIIEHKKYKDEVYTDMKVTPKYEKKIFKDPVITKRKFPVTSEYKK